jgi:ATP-dependent DNA helicase DinG
VLLTELHDTDTWNSLDLLRVDILRTIAKCSTIIDDALENEDDEAQSSEIKTHGMLLKQAGRLIDDIFNGEPNYIAWAIVTGSKEPYNISLIAAPIDIGEFLRELLFSTRASVIMTSATLMVNQSFDYFKQRFGIEGDVAEKFVFESVGSPFNYKEHMLCVIPDDLNKISEKENSLAIAEYLASIINIMQGRTLVLFTSYKMMEQTHKVTKHLIDDHGITILCQGMHGSRRALLSRFRHSKKTVLFGTSSFWEGVDIQGEALSCVVIVKLPFAVPTDPIVQARSALIENNGGSSFNDYSVPQAVIRFKQGIGRLIRSDRDHGTVVVIDERIFSKSYGKAFLKALPDCEIFKSSRGDVLQKMSAWMKVS